MDVREDEGQYYGGGKTVLNAGALAGQYVEIDSTLTKTGAAADAKTVGDKLSEHDSEISGASITASNAYDQVREKVDAAFSGFVFHHNLATDGTRVTAWASLGSYGAIRVKVRFENDSGCEDIVKESILPISVDGKFYVMNRGANIDIGLVDGHKFSFARNGLANTTGKFDSSTAPNAQMLDNMNARELANSKEFSATHGGYAEFNGVSVSGDFGLAIGNMYFNVTGPARLILPNYLEVSNNPLPFRFLVHLADGVSSSDVSVVDMSNRTIITNNSTYPYRASIPGSALGLSGAWKMVTARVYKNPQGTEIVYLEV